MAFSLLILSPRQILGPGHEGSQGNSSQKRKKVGRTGMPSKTEGTSPLKKFTGWSTFVPQMPLEYKQAGCNTEILRLADSALNFNFFTTQFPTGPTVELIIFCRLRLTGIYSP